MQFEDFLVMHLSNPLVLIGLDQYGIHKRKPELFVELEQSIT